MTKRKFGDGGEVDNAAKNESSYDIGDNSPSDTPTTKKQSFKEAFASARAAGDKTFAWNGKSYSTALAPAKKPSTTPARESTLPTKGGSGGAKPGVIGKASDQKFMGYAKGGAVRGWGCTQKGMKRGGKC